MTKNVFGQKINKILAVNNKRKTAIFLVILLNCTLILHRLCRNYEYIAGMNIDEINTEDDSYSF